MAEARMLREPPLVMTLADEPVGEGVGVLTGFGVAVGAGGGVVAEMKVR